MTEALAFLVVFGLGALVGQRMRDGYWIAASRVDSPRALARGDLYQVVREGDAEKAIQVLANVQRERAKEER